VSTKRLVCLIWLDGPRIRVTESGCSTFALLSRLDQAPLPGHCMRWRRRREERERHYAVGNRPAIGASHMCDSFQSKNGLGFDSPSSSRFSVWAEDRRAFDPWRRAWQWSAPLETGGVSAARCALPART